jgi:hypothetical protein
MTVEQTAINHRALIAAADKLNRIGYDGDAYRFVEGLILAVIADGYRPIEKPIPARGTGASRDAIEAAKQAAADAVAAARERRGAKYGSEETDHAR